MSGDFYYEKEKCDSGRKMAQYGKLKFVLMFITVAKSMYYMRLWASFFVKLLEKIPGGFLGLFKKIWLLVRELCSLFSSMH